ncbi:MAG: SelB C-terminal domain-containing protein, partial [Acidobacteriota bacterium]|nr:SelB C-terminal domain-containing protein [Acidobacteriota bacterium]
DGVFVEHEVFARLEQAAVAEVESFHRRAPLERGLSRETLREKVFAHAAHEVFRAVLAQAEAAGALASEREVVRTAAHRLVLSAEDEQLRERLESIYQDAALAAPTFAEAVSRAAAGNSRPPVRPEHARRILQLLLDAGALVRVSAELYFHRHALDQLIRDVRDYGAQHTPERLIDVSAFKDLAGISRKYAIPLLEYLDRERVTRRAGDRRLIL